MNSISLQTYRWYHGRVPRADTERLLNGKMPGVYLVRDSGTSVGDFVLSVSENNKVSHYIINNKSNHYKIGDQTFADIPSIINFYKEHLLDTTMLTGAIEREMRVQTLYSFDGRDPDDLPFQKGETLTIIKQDEEEWWTAENRSGERGSIPVNYVQILSDSSVDRPMHSLPRRPVSTPVVPSPTTYVDNPSRPTKPHCQSTVLQPYYPSTPTGATGRSLARATLDRVCSPYDSGQLSFKKGDLLTVVSQNENGIWEGELNDKTGEFPMSHVNLIDPNTMEPYSNGFRE